MTNWVKLKDFARNRHAEKLILRKRFCWSHGTWSYGACMHLHFLPFTDNTSSILVFILRTFLTHYPHSHSHTIKQSTSYCEPFKTSSSASSIRLCERGVTIFESTRAFSKKCWLKHSCFKNVGFLWINARVKHADKINLETETWCLKLDRFIFWMVFCMITHHVGCFVSSEYFLHTGTNALNVLGRQNVFWHNDPILTFTQ